MKQYLKNLIDTPNETTLKKARWEEEKCKIMISHLLHQQVKTDKEKQNLAISIKYEQEYLEEAKRVKEEIAYILTTKK